MDLQRWRTVLRRALGPFPLTLAVVTTLAAVLAVSLFVSGSGPEPSASVNTTAQQAILPGDVTPTPSATPTRTPSSSATATPSTREIRSRLTKLEPVKWTNNHGPYEVDMGNGTVKKNDGAKMLAQGTRYDWGFGVHAPSSLEFSLGGAYDSFESLVAVNDVGGGTYEVGDKGTVRFNVYVDGRRVLRTQVLRGSDAAHKVVVPLNGAETLRLEVDDAGDGAKADTAFWAYPTLGRTSTDTSS